MTTEKAQDSAEPISAASELSAGLGRCGTCKNFTRYTEPINIRHYGAHAGTCDSTKFSYHDEGRMMSVDGLEYWEDEYFAKGFSVGDQFGCIHWECSTSPQGNNQE